MSQDLILIDSKTRLEAGRARVEGNDVFFPDDIQGWTDVLDCRHDPYPDQTLEEICELAEGVHKPYVLVAEDQLESDSPTESDAA